MSSSPIEARTARRYWVRIAVLWGMFALFGFIISAMAKQPVQGFFGLFLMVAPAFLLIRRRLTWAHRFDDGGVALRSGKRFAWADLQKVIDVHAVRGGAKWHNHYVLAFKQGRALVFDRMLDNSGEILALLKTLERAGKP